jgi:dihydroorotate dehydrogenase (NAD+) catalytic subunit
MVDHLDGLDHPLQALEIGLEQSSPEEIQAVLNSAGQCQLPLLARLPLGIDQELISAAIEAGVNALVLGPPRGSLLNARGEIISGRLYGPAIFPLAIKALENLVQAIAIPVILGCGIFSAEHLLTALKAGAAGVQLDTILWVDPTKLLQEIQTLTHPENTDIS